MSAKNSRKKSGTSQTDWKFLRSASDEGIDFSDIPRLDAGFWRKAKVRMPKAKESVTLRLDHEVLDWFKASGPGYQTRINAILRSYKEHAAHA